TPSRPSRDGAGRRALSRPRPRRLPHPAGRAPRRPVPHRTPQTRRGPAGAAPRPPPSAFPGTDRDCSRRQEPQLGDETLDGLLVDLLTHRSEPAPQLPEPGHVLGPLLLPRVEHRLELVRPERLPEPLTIPVHRRRR